MAGDAVLSCDPKHAIAIGQDVSGDGAPETVFVLGEYGEGFAIKPGETIPTSKPEKAAGAFPRTPRSIVSQTICRRVTMKLRPVVSNHATGTKKCPQPHVSIGGDDQTPKPIDGQAIVSREILEGSSVVPRHPRALRRDPYVSIRG